MKKEYVTFWTTTVFGEGPKRVFGRNPWKAIVNSWFWAQESPNEIRFLVFEVGGDLVHDGTLAEAYNKFESEHTGLRFENVSNQKFLRHLTCEPGGCECGMWSIEEYGPLCPSC